MDAIPPDVAKKLLNRDFANLVKRVQAGGKISRMERSMLQSMAAGAGGDGPAFVRNFVELAVALKVTRQTINGWKKFEDAPKTAANGLHDVGQWREQVGKRPNHYLDCEAMQAAAATMLKLIGREAVVAADTAPEDAAVDAPETA